ncbi:phage protein [Streptococcus pneumoniae]|nr:phage protein [Streptococcus pneumoniae]
MKLQRYVKNILARLRELPLHDREVWLKAIMSEFEQDFSRAKWREGYEQGKIEGMVEREKVIVPQCVAEYIEFKKKNNFHVYGAMRVIEDHYDKKVPDWFYENNIEKFCLAWLDGYEVEKEKRYLVKVKGVHFTNYLISGNRKDIWFFHSAYEPEHQIIAHTRKELEEAGFGWVFDCPGIEIEEVEE